MYQAIPFADNALSTGQGWLVKGPEGLWGESGPKRIAVGGMTMSRAKAEKAAEDLESMAKDNTEPEFHEKEGF